MIRVIEWLDVSHHNVCLQQDSNVNSVRLVSLSHHNVSLQQDSNDNSDRVVNCVTSQCESTAGQ